jgi:hypothetical protein
MFHLAADAAPSHKDVVIAAVGAAAALAGLVLVFVGLLLTTRESLRGQVRATELVRLATASWIGVAVFILSLISLILGTFWLSLAGGETFYVVVLASFLADVLVLAIGAVAATRVLLS